MMRNMRFVPWLLILASCMPTEPDYKTVARAVVLTGAPVLIDPFGNIAGPVLGLRSGHQAFVWLPDTSYALVDLNMADFEYLPVGYELANCTGDTYAQAGLGYRFQNSPSTPAVEYVGSGLPFGLLPVASIRDTFGVCANQPMGTFIERSRLVALVPPVRLFGPFRMGEQP